MLIVRIVVFVGLLPTVLMAQEAKKYALLVGVNKYEHAEMNRPEPLQYAEADVTELAAILKEAGYEVDLLVGPKATQKAIQEALANLKGRGNADGVVLVALAGHGVQMENDEEAYYCPFDCDMQEATRDGKKIVDKRGDPILEPDPKTCVKLGTIVEQFKTAKAGTRLMLVDCCRNDPATGRGRAVGSGIKQASLPRNTAVLLSCSQGQRAWEDKRWAHGAFFFHVLKGLRDGKETVAGMTDYLEKAVPADVKSLRDAPVQVPHLLLNGSGLNFGLAGKVKPAPLTFTFDAKAIAKAREEWASYLKVKPDYKNDYGMKFVLIPPGQLKMGAEEAWKDTATMFPSEDEGTFAHEHPVREVAIKNPLYAGTTEVTVAQWRDFVADRKYRTDQERGVGTENPTGAAGKDDERNWDNPGFKEKNEQFPVTHITHNDAQAFCAWLSAKEGKKYRLPTQAEWEYLCRAGTTTRYWVGDDPESLISAGNVNNKKHYYTPDNTFTFFYYQSNPTDQRKPSTWFKMRAAGSTHLEFRLRTEKDRQYWDPKEVSPSVALAKDEVQLTNKDTIDVKVGTDSTTTTLRPGQTVTLKLKTIDVGKSWRIEGDDGYAELAPVGSFKANPFGLFDMHGNVWEWCEDMATIDGRDIYVIRGGCFL